MNEVEISNKKPSYSVSDETAVRLGYLKTSLRTCNYCINVNDIWLTVCCSFLLHGDRILRLVHIQILQEEAAQRQEEEGREGGAGEQKQLVGLGSSPG